MAVTAADVPVPRDLRLPVVRRRVRVPRPGRPRGLGAALPDCVGKAGDNGFLRFRLRQALTERARRGRAGGGAPRGRRPPRPATAPADAAAADARRADRDAEMLAYYEARAAEYDDWYLRRGRYARGADPRRRLERRARRGRPLARRPADPRRDRGARRRHRLVVAAPRREGRAVALRRGAGAARSGARAPRRPRPARPPPRARRVGRAGPAGRRAVRRLLAEPRAARPARRRSSGSSAAGSSPAASFAFIDSLPGSPVRRGRPPDARRRRLASAASTTAASSRSSRSTTSRPSWRPRSPEPGFDDAAVTTTGRFFLIGSARARDLGGRVGRRARRADRRHRCATARGYTPRDVPPGQVARSRPSAPASWPRR